MVRKLVMLLITAILVTSLFVIGSAFAANPATQKVTINIKGDVLQLVGPGGPAALPDTTLTGADQVVAGSLGNFKVIDPRGTGNGWTLTMKSSDFEEINNPTTRKIAATGFEVTNANYTAGPGNGGVTAANGFLNGAGYAILNTPGVLGRGTSDVAPLVELAIPAETWAGTYAATVTATLTSP